MTAFTLFLFHFSLLVVRALSVLNSGNGSFLHTGYVLGMEALETRPVC
jgi:hypothetical protein